MAHEKGAQDVAAQLARLAKLVECLLPPGRAADVALDSPALRWRRQGALGYLSAVHTQERPATRLGDLLCIDRQKSLLERNIAQFLAGLPANNALLWGPRGTGKSTLVKALLHAYQGRGLRGVEVEKQHLAELPDIVECIQRQSGRFVIFCDDMSFAADDPDYRSIKVALDGSLCALPEDILLLATSNYRHMVPERQEENLASQVSHGTLRHGDAVEEQLSLSDRFGLQLAFHPFDQQQYLAIVGAWLDKLGCNKLDAPAREAALRWALARGGRSGRIANQFARDWVGRALIEKNSAP